MQAQQQQLALQHQENLMLREMLLKREHQVAGPIPQTSSDDVEHAQTDVKGVDDEKVERMKKSKDDQSKDSSKSDKAKSHSGSLDK